MNANTSEIVRLRRQVGIPDDGPTVEQRERWHRQEAQGEDLMVTAWLARRRVA